MTVWEFEVSHDVAQARGETMDLDNLHTLCRHCNGSMGEYHMLQDFCSNNNNYKKTTIDNDCEISVYRRRKQCVIVDESWLLYINNARF